CFAGQLSEQSLRTGESSVDGMSAWVETGHFGVPERCPFYPQKRTFIGVSGMSALCQKRTLIDGVDRFASSLCGGLRVGKRIGRCDYVFGLPAVTLTFSVLPDCLVRQGP